MVSPATTDPASKYETRYGHGDMFLLFLGEHLDPPTQVYPKELVQVRVDPSRQRKLAWGKRTNDLPETSETQHSSMGCSLYPIGISAKKGMLNWAVGNETIIICKCAHG